MTSDLFGIQQQWGQVHWGAGTRSFKVWAGVGGGEAMPRAVSGGRTHWARTVWGTWGQAQEAAWDTVATRGQQPPSLAEHRVRSRDADGSSLLGPSPVAAIQRHLPNSSVILEPACQVGGLTPSHRREKRPRDKVPARSALKALENGLGSPQLPGRPQLPPPAAPHFTPPHSAAAWAPGVPSRTLS